MKKCFLSGVAVLVAPWLLSGGVTKWVSVVQVTDNFRSVSYTVMSNEEYNEAAKKLWDRNRVLTQAVRLAREEWVKSEETKDKVFPSSIVVPAEVKRLKTFPERADADAYISAMQAKDEESASNDRRSTSYVEKRIRILRDELENPPFAGRRAPDNWRKVREEELGVWLKELAARRAKEQELQSLKSSAMALIESKTDQLLQGSATGQDS